MARKSSKPIPVDWKALEEQLAVYDDRQSTDAAGKHFFHEAVDGEEAWDAMEILRGRGTYIEQAFLDGRTQDAFGELGCLIIDIKARVMAMAGAVNAAKRRIAHSVKVTQAAPRARKKHSERTKDRYATIRKKVQAVLDSNPMNTITYAREIVAEEREDGKKDGKLLQSLGTVKTATAGMKSPPRKMKK